MDKHIMNEEYFWSIIEAAWPSTVGTTADRLRAFEGVPTGRTNTFRHVARMLNNLEDTLDLLDADSLLLFNHILHQKVYDLDQAAIHVYVRRSADGFLYFRGFVVAMGRAYYEALLTDHSKARTVFECESILYLARQVYEDKFGDMPWPEFCIETGSNPVGWPPEVKHIPYWKMRDPDDHDIVNDNG